LPRGRAVIIKPEEYEFYGGDITLLFDPSRHSYSLIRDGREIEIPSVSKVCKIIDKSNALIPWTAKVVTEKLLNSLASVDFPISESELVKLIISAKSAHKEHLEDAGNIGKQAHQWIEELIKFRLDSSIDWISDYPSDESVKSCCEAAINWMEKHNVQWVCTERKIYSREYEYAGTLDGIAYCDSCENKACCPESFTRRLSLIDWKSSNYLYPEYLYQTAAYQRAFSEETGEIIEDRWIVQLPKDKGGFNAWHMTEGYEEDFKIFTHCLALTKGVESVNLRLKENKGWIKKLKSLAVKEKNVS
jgi:hypothetical protein